MSVDVYPSDTADAVDDLATQESSTLSFEGRLLYTRLAQIESQLARIAFLLEQMSDVSIGTEDVLDVRNNR